CSEWRDHELPHVQAEAVFGQDRVELIPEWNELRFHAFKLRNAAQRGQRVRQKLTAQFLLGIAGRDEQPANQSLVIFEHVECVSDGAAVFQDGGAGEGPRVDELLDQLRRGAVIPAQLFPPLLRLFGEQWLELPGGQLAQIDNLHGSDTRPSARSVHNHFYHIIQWRSRMYLRNMEWIGYPWRAANCATMRVPSGTYFTQRTDRPAGRDFAPGHESERMGFISEIRHPTTWYTQLAIAILALVIFALLAAGTVSGYLVYRMLSPARSHSEIDLKNFPGHPEILDFTVIGEGPRDGWFFPGLKTAPTIVLCPAYESSRGELLTLAAALQDQQYNVLAFDFSAHGSAGGRSSLGLREVAELRAPMNAVANRGDVDVNRFGLWGVNLGAYVALAEATGDPRVRAIVAEAPYGHPKEMVALQVSRSGLGSLPLVTGMSQMIFG